jgi:class 3 adenylate cyclase
VTQKVINFDEEVRKTILSTEKEFDSTQNHDFEEKTVVLVDLVGAAAAKDKLGHSRGMRRCQLHNKMAAKTFERFEGKVIKYIGDAVLATFSCRYNAVIACIVFREALERIKPPGEEFQVPMETRIALTTGAVEVFETGSGSDIGGQVVDKAARLQAAASPGQILAEIGVVEPIRLILKERMPFIKPQENGDISELLLKGLKDHVRVLEITTADKPFGNPPSEYGQYISALLDSISTCKSRAWLSIRSMKSRKNRKDMGFLQDRLVESGNRSGVDVRILCDEWDADSLETAAEFESLGLNTRFCESQMDSCVNLVDKNIIIFNTKKQNRFFSISRYWKMTSYHVNSVLASDFQLRWEEAISPRLHLAKILDRTFKNCIPEIDRNEVIDFIRDRFDIDKGEFIEGCLELLGFIRKIRFILVVGRPGTGKNSIRELLAKSLENKLGAKTKELADYDLLKKMSESDINCERFISRGGASFTIKDPAVLTEVPGNISSLCLAAPDTHITWLIEFSPIRYSEALSAFDPEMLKKAAVIHISSDKKHGYKRLEGGAGTGGATVTGDAIETYFKEDKVSEVCKEMGIPCIGVDNNTPINNLNSKVEMIVRQLRDIAVSIYYERKR